VAPDEVGVVGLIVPLAEPPITDQVTVCVAVPVTVAVNACVAPAFTVAELGFTVTTTEPVPARVTVADPMEVPLAALVAVTVTVAGEGRDAGAV
jgi:hypothetical protein